MKTVRIYIIKLLLTFSMLLACLWATAQCIHSDTLSGCPDTLYVGNENTPSPTIPTAIYSADEYLHSDGSVLPPDTVDYKSKHIRLNKGFKVQDEGKFSAYIEEHGCETGFNANAYYVNDSSLEGDIYTTNVGSDFTGIGSKENPFASLGFVIGKVDLSDGDTIYIDAGTFNDTFIEITDTINNLAIIGAGSANTIFDRNYEEDEDDEDEEEEEEEDDDDDEEEDNDDENDGEDYPPTGAPFATISTDDILLKGMTIQGYDYFIPGRGNALSVVNGNCVVINNVNITDNVGYGEHAALAIYGENTSVEIQKSSISFNYGFEETAQGGGVDIIGNDNIVNIDSTTIVGNGRSEFGGGLRNFGDNSINFTDSSISDNVSGKGGGAISSVGRTEISIIGTCVLNNVSTGTPTINHGGGGEIVLAGGGALRFSENTKNVTISNAVFEDNKAGVDGNYGIGGAIFAGDAPIEVDSSLHFLSIESTIFKNNIATDGADIFIDNFQTSINNSSFETENVTHLFNGGYVTTNVNNSGTPTTLGPVNLINTDLPIGTIGGKCIDIPNILCFYTPSGEPTQYFCANENVTLSSLVLIGCPGITYWYSQSTGGNTIPPNTPLQSGTTYYASCYPARHFCSGNNRFAVTVYLIDLSECGGRTSCDQSYTICPGESVELFSDYNDDIYDYDWNTMENLTISNEVIATPTVTTAYAVTVSSSEYCSGSYTLTFTINVATNDDIMFPDDISTCIDNYSNPQLVVQGGESYQWAPNTGLSCYNCPNPTVNIGASETYSITVTDANGCDHTGSVNVNVQEALNVTAYVQNNVACIGEQVVLVAGGADSYQWTPSNLVICNDANCAAPYFIANEDNATTYTVTGFSNGCVSESEVTVLLAPEYGVDISMATDGCSVTFMPEPFIEGVSYEWSVTNYGIIPDEDKDGIVSYEFPNNGTYNVCLTIIGEECGQEVQQCESFDMETCTCIGEDCFTFSANPTVSYSLNASCTYSDIALMAGATGGTPPYEFLWTGSNGFTSLLENPGIANVTEANSGVYAIIVTDANGCSITGETEFINIQNIEDPVITASDVGCEGGTVVLTVPQYEGASYTWNTPYGVVSNTSQLVLSPTDISTHNGTYSVIIEVNECTLSSVPFDLDINGSLNISPTVSYSGEENCPLYDIEIVTVPNYEAPPYIYSWTGPNGFTSNNASIVISGVTSSDEGTYTVIVTDTNGCSGQGSVTVSSPCDDCSSLSEPVISIITNGCEGEAITIGVDSYEASAVYNWITPNGETTDITGFGTNELTINPANPSLHNGIYSVSIMIDGCTVKSENFDLQVDNCGDCSDIHINEFAYDCMGPDDTDEFIEIVVSDSFTGDESAIQIDFYSGGQGSAVYHTVTLGDLSVIMVVNGTDKYYYITFDDLIQNGMFPNTPSSAPDGIALSYSGVVCEFISYEGIIEANDGPAMNMTSEDVEVLQEDSGICMVQSIQLLSNGEWGLACATPGQVNQELNIGDMCDDGDPATTGDIVGADCTCSGTPPPCPGGFINEFAYDCSSTDNAEFIEVAIPSGINPAAFQIVRFNGSTGEIYGTPEFLNITGNISDYPPFTDGDYVFYTILLNTNGLQNGSPDGIALTYNDELLCDAFISYEGQFMATEDPANGITSTDVGVEQPQNNEYIVCMEGGMSQSIQLINGTWQRACSTPGANNNESSIIGAPCDDGDPNTGGDRIRENCICLGDNF